MPSRNRNKKLIESKRKDHRSPIFELRLASISSTACNLTLCQCYKPGRLAAARPLLWLPYLDLFPWLLRSEIYRRPLNFCPGPSISLQGGIVCHRLATIVATRPGLVCQMPAGPIFLSTPSKRYNCHARARGDSPPSRGIARTSMVIAHC